VTTSRKHVINKALFGLPYFLAHAKLFTQINKLL